MKTKDRLVKALEQAKAPWDMIERAKMGYYDDFESEIATPITQLVEDCQEHKLYDIARRAREGEFDATREEADEWFRKEGLA